MLLPLPEGRPGAINAGGWRFLADDLFDFFASFVSSDGNKTSLFAVFWSLTLLVACTSVLSDFHLEVCN